MEEQFQSQLGTPSIYQAASEKGSFGQLNIAFVLTFFIAPTRNEVLLHLTQPHSRARSPSNNEGPPSSSNKGPESTPTHADINQVEPVTAFWVNDGLEIEDAQ